MVAHVANEDVLQTSHSDLGTMSQCPRLWWLGTWRALRPLAEPMHGPLKFGTRVHKALEIAALRQAWDVDQIAQIWNNLMEIDMTTAEAAGMFVSDLSTESKLGHAMLTNYIVWRDENRMDEHWKIVGVESRYGEHLDVLLPDGRTVQMFFRGKLDVLEEHVDSGMLVVVDYKTAANLSEVTLFAQEGSDQGPFYLELVARDQPDRIMWGVSYILLRKVQHTKTSKPPYYKRMNIPITDVRRAAVLRNMRAKAIEVVDKIDRLTAGQDGLDVAPHKVGWWCKSCPFKGPCGFMQKGEIVAAEQMLADKYQQVDPWARYQEETDLVGVSYGG